MKDYATLLTERTGAVLKITTNRPEVLNAQSRILLEELDDAFKEADDRTDVSVIILAGAGKHFCTGYDLGGVYAGRAQGEAQAETSIYRSSIASYDDDCWFLERQQALTTIIFDLHKPVIARVQGNCMAGGTDLALMCDFVIAAADAKIGFPATRANGSPPNHMWIYHCGPQWAKRLLLTGDCLSGREAADWGLAIEAPEPEDLDERTEVLVQRIAAMPLNQLMMVKLALNSALLAQGVENSRMVSTVFDGIARHTREGYSFAARAMEAGFKQAVRERDAAPYDDFGPSTNKG